jgi:hypothetical protein
MFLKRLERRKNGKRHTYGALVESIRTAGGSRHRVVAYLGELMARESSGWATLGRRLDRKDRPPPTRFDPPRPDERADDEPVLVNLKGVRLQRLRDFGDVWLATRTADRQPGKTLRLRCVTTPDEGQEVLLSRLGLTLPHRLRRVDEVAQM